MQDYEIARSLGRLEGEVGGLRIEFKNFTQNFTAEITADRQRRDSQIDSLWQEMRDIRGNKPPPEYNNHIHCWQKSKLRITNSTVEKYLLNSIGAAVMGVILAILKLLGQI